MSGLHPQLTGRVRYRVETDRSWFGLGGKRQRVVVQHEVMGFVPEYLGGSISGEFRRWWVDSKPEWLMQDTGAVTVTESEG